MRMEFTWNAAFVMQSHSWMFRVHQNFDLLIQLMSPLAFRFETEKTHKTLKLHRMNVLTGATSHKAPDRATIGTTTVS